MPHDRFFLDQSFHLNDEVWLDSDETRHLSVMRIQNGETVELVNGQNQLAQAILLSPNRKAHLRIHAINEKKPSMHIILCQALPRFNRLESIVEKGTELGVSELWLFPGEKSEKMGLTEPQLQRLRLISISALKQCGRLDLPKICLKPPLLDWADPIGCPIYFGKISPNAPFFGSVFYPSPRVALFIGPESGFSTQECAYLDKIGGKGVRLEQNILRVDTASLVFLSLVRNQNLLNFNKYDL